MPRLAQLYCYRLPIQTRLILRGKELAEREGLIVHLTQGSQQGFGEIAPLPNFSRETLAQAEMQVKAWLIAWEKGENSALETLLPSVAFGVSCALAELAGTLSPHANFASVPLCLTEKDAEKLKNSPLAKLKIGVQAAEKEGIFANRLLTQLPKLALRLDANRRWALKDALAFAAQISPDLRGRIAFIEEPCQTPDQSRQFARETGIQIAWDETTREPDFQLQAEPYLAAIVLKPTLLGSLEKCAELIRQAHALGLEAVVSSSIESSLGLTQLARFASQHTPHTVAGLDTLNLMRHQLLRQWADSPLPLEGLESEFVVEKFLNEPV